MTIAAGDRLPDITIRVVSADEVREMNTSEIFAAKRAVLIGVPGAFTPTCSLNHVPGFIENHAAILARGIDLVAIVSVNDHHVMRAWARHSGGEGKLLYLADGNGTFTRALGLGADMSDRNYGYRSHRYSMIVDDLTVRQLNLEDAISKAEISGAARILEQL